MVISSQSPLWDTVIDIFPVNLRSVIGRPSIKMLAKKLSKHSVSIRPILGDCTILSYEPSYWVRTFYNRPKYKVGLITNFVRCLDLLQLFSNVSCTLLCWKLLWPQQGAYQQKMHSWTSSNRQSDNLVWWLLQTVEIMVRWMSTNDWFLLALLRILCLLPRWYL